MDCTTSGLNSFDTKGSDIGISFEEIELLTEKEGENHGLFITNLCLSISVSLLDFISTVIFPEYLEHFVSSMFEILSLRITFVFLSHKVVPSVFGFLLFGSPDFFLFLNGVLFRFLLIKLSLMKRKCFQISHLMIPFQLHKDILSYRC